MAHVALTGAHGFVGWHTRVAALASGVDTTPVAVGAHFDAGAASEAISGSARLLHIAGVNRADDNEVREGNELFARQIAAIVRSVEAAPSVVVFANSTQVGNGSVYGHAKAAAADILAAAAGEVGAEFIDLRFPNVFGEHGRPFYNSVVSTFCHLLATGGLPTIDVDRELTLLHAQDAADLLLGTAADGAVETRSTVTSLLADLQEIAAQYAAGDIPDLSSPHRRNLFNTYRSFLFNDRPYATSGRTGAASPRPDGIYLHRRQAERVMAAAGSGTLHLQRPFTTETRDLALVAADEGSIDIPTLWTSSVSGTDDFVATGTLFGFADNDGVAGSALG